MFFWLQQIIIFPNNNVIWFPQQISDDVEFVMLSKGFYQNLAGVQLKQRVYAKVTAPKATYTQVTDEDCCLIRKGTQVS